MNTYEAILHYFATSGHGYDPIYWQEKRFQISASDREMAEQIIRKEVQSFVAAMEEQLAKGLIPEFFVDCVRIYDGEVCFLNEGTIAGSFPQFYEWLAREG